LKFGLKKAILATLISIYFYCGWVEDVCFQSLLVSPCIHTHPSSLQCSFCIPNRLVTSVSRGHCNSHLMACIDFFLVLFEYITAFILFFLKCFVIESLVKCIQVLYHRSPFQKDFLASFLYR